MVGDVGGSITALGNLAQEQIRYQIDDALDEPQDEPGHGEVPVKTGLRAKINWLFKAFRNRKVEDDSTWSLLNSDGATVDQTADKFIAEMKGQNVVVPTVGEPFDV